MDAVSEPEWDGEPFIAAEGWREEAGIRFVPESAVAEAVAAERERIRPLIARWRRTGGSLAASHPAWASHFYDCANELEHLIAAPG